VLTGPILFNFLAISEMLVTAQGATITADEAHLTQHLQQLLANKTLRHDQGHRAKMVVEKNRGALDKLLKLIEQFVDVKSVAFR
jgi:3-deoxy-D-manno-octulosonic-acid transferase